MENGQSISVKDIAQMAGTSVATVSRVINQNGRFSKETEQRILHIIEEYGYQPNQMARSLRVRNSRAIGVLVPDINNEFYSSVTKQAQMTLSDENYISLICNTDERPEEANKYLQIFRAHKVDGLIYIGNNEIEIAEEIPTIYIDRDPRDQVPQTDDFHMIECDNIEGGYLAGKELIRKGSRKFAAISYDLTISTHKKRLQGFRKALEENGYFMPDSRIVMTNKVDHTEGERAMEKLFSEHPDVDGVFILSDIMAFGAINWLRARNIPVPGQVRIVGFDDISMSNIMGLTTIRQPMNRMGKMAAERLIRILSGDNIPAQRIRLPVELVVRNTT